MYYLLTGSQSLTVFYYFQIIKKGVNYTEILDLQLQKVIKKNQSNFIDSLKLTNIDVEHGTWTSDAVDQNAYDGAISLILFASQEGIFPQCGRLFLRTIAENLNDRESSSIMAWIYAAYVRADRFPPYTIIQHMVNQTLFHEYCVYLQKWLYQYFQRSSSDEQTNSSLFFCP